MSAVTAFLIENRTLTFLDMLRRSAAYCSLLAAYRFTMSLEFTVEYPCVLRARYSEKRLREWGRLSNLHTILTTGDQSAPGPDKIAWIENASAQMELVQVETAVCAN